MVSNVDCGIFIHNGYDNIIKGNRCFSSKVAGILISYSSAHNNIIVDNVFEPLSTTNGRMVKMQQQTLVPLTRIAITTLMFLRWLHR